MQRTDQMLLIGFVPLFRGFTKQDVRALLDRAQEVEFRDGATIMHEGTVGRDFYLLLQGEAAITVGRRTVGRARAGDYFGEMALIDGGVRSATVTAKSPVVALRLKQRDLLELIDGHPKLARTIMIELCRRLRAATNSLRA
jgi:CRP/FNR family transcriptional regulator, cyclic AMP receptor protein